MDLETWFQIHTNVSNFEMASPKPLKIEKDHNFQLSFIEMTAI